MKLLMTATALAALLTAGGAMAQDEHRGHGYVGGGGQVQHNPPPAANAPAQAAPQARPTYPAGPAPRWGGGGGAVPPSGPIAHPSIPAGGQSQGWRGGNGAAGGQVRNQGQWRGDNGGARGQGQGWRGDNSGGRGGAAQGQYNNGQDQWSQQHHNDGQGGGRWQGGDGDHWRGQGDGGRRDGWRGEGSRAEGWRRDGDRHDRGDYHLGYGGWGVPGWTSDRRDYPRYDRRYYPQYVRPDRRFEWRGDREWRGQPGYYYRHWGYGERLPYGWFDRSFWISDWDSYDLPPPPYGYQWVRVGPDVLLIDIATGVVVETVYSLFE